MHVQHRTHHGTLWRKIQAVRPECMANKRADYSIGRWQQPGLVGQFSQPNLPAACPVIMRSGDYNDSFFEEDFGMQVLIEGLRETPEEEINGSLAQGPVLLAHFVHERSVDFG